MSVQPREGNLEHRFLFIGGLHRSGTSLLYKVLGTDPRISIFTDTGVIEDEGQFLQEVYKRDGDHGGPGRFALDPCAHLTECSPLLGQARKRLFEEWKPYWDFSKTILAEKSPANLIRSRFLQAVFPEASFIFVIRHPIAVTMATTKWTGTYVRHLLEHWCLAHAILMEDSKRLDRVLVLHYEQLVTEPKQVQETLEAFLGLKLSLSWPALDPDVNSRYFRRWKMADFYLKKSYPRLKHEAKRARNYLEMAWVRARYERVIKHYGYTFDV